MSYESASRQLGNINFGKNTTGKRSAGKPHAAFDEAGTGDGQLSVPRQFSTLPVRGVKFFYMAEYCDTPQSKERRNWEYKACLSK